MSNGSGNGIGAANVPAIAQAPVPVPAPGPAPAPAPGPAPVPVRLKPSQKQRVASVPCNSNGVEMLGPDWNGTFSSSSDDGVYPSESRTCVWTIRAATLANNKPTIVRLSFWRPIQLICGMDYLTIYDGPDTRSPVIARLCGNIWMDSTPVLYSSGPSLTAVFTTVANTPASWGFKAGWVTVEPCNVCVGSGRGTCNGGECACVNDRFSGVVCEKDTAGYKDFFPRSQHAMAYDVAKDMVYIMGGTSEAETYTNDLLTYSFATNKWNTIELSAQALQPDARYGHFAFVHEGELYFFGGVSSIGGRDEIWRLSGKKWVRPPVNNAEQRPVSRVAPACVVVTRNNSTKLYIFGGMVPGGTTMNDLHTYDLGKVDEMGKVPMWKRIDHQNSVGLAGASAIYHPATDSIYFFGGMVNLTTRNTITYQYLIAQELWYAHAPRVDPLTSTVVESWAQPFTNDTTTDDDDGDEQGDATRAAISAPAYPPAVLFDPISSVWAPAGLAGDDHVVIYGGMRPYGPGVNERDQSCLVKSISVYDLSCQRWTEYDVSEAGAALRGRVNHTMILKPPGSAGGSKTAWTAYIFGGFDGSHRNDMLNITLNFLPTTPASVNSCRALRWCSHYDDCQNCNPNYCSYIDGLCLFDTEKAKATSALVGGEEDAPQTGTLQELIRKRPDLAGNVLDGPNDCPARITLDLKVPFIGELQPGEEKTFKVYISDHERDVQFLVETTPRWALEFKTLNVWEGYMNMFWRADHGLTDDSWDGKSGVSSPRPNDLSEEQFWNMTEYPPVITPAGTRDSNQLLSRWQRFSGLDASPSTSGLRMTGSGELLFLARDPRRFSGYYVFSLRNKNDAQVEFAVTVNVLVPDEQGNVAGKRFDLGTLGFIIVGLILAAIVLLYLVRKIRWWMIEREYARQTLELLRLEQEEEEEEEEERRRRNGGAAVGRRGWSRRNQDGVVEKPLYRVVLGVQAFDQVVKQGLSKHVSNDGFRFRPQQQQQQKPDQQQQQQEQHEHPERVWRATTIRYEDDSRDEGMVPTAPPLLPSSRMSQGGQMATPIEGKRAMPRERSDYIRDLGSLAANIRDRQDRMSNRPISPMEKVHEPKEERVSLDFEHIASRYEPMPPGAMGESGQDTFERSKDLSGGGDNEAKKQLGRSQSQVEGRRDRTRRFCEGGLKVDGQSDDDDESGGGLNVWRHSVGSSFGGRRNTGSTNNHGNTSHHNFGSGKGATGLQRGWSLQSLGRSASLKRFRGGHGSHVKKSSSEEYEGLTRIESSDYEGGAARTSNERCRPTDGMNDGGDQSDHEGVIDLGMLSSTASNHGHFGTQHLLQQQQQPQPQLQQQQGQLAVNRRNPFKVQPISVEPVPFHGALVPQTRMYLRRYHRNLAWIVRRRQLNDGQPSSSDMRTRSRSQRDGRTVHVVNQRHPSISSRRSVIRPAHSQGSFRHVQRTASRMTSRTFGSRSIHSGPLTRQNSGTSGGGSDSQQPFVPHHHHQLLNRLHTPQQIQNDEKRDGSTSIEMISLSDSNHGNHRMEYEQGKSQGDGGGRGLKVEAETRMNETMAPLPRSEDTVLPRRPVRMRGTQEYAPGPLLAVNVIIVFPGDAGTRHVLSQGEPVDPGQERGRDGGLEGESERNRGHGGGEKMPFDGAVGGYDRQDTLYNSDYNNYSYDKNKDKDMDIGKEEDEDEEMEKRLPPMAIGTLLVPDPVRWWAFRAQHLEDRRQFERKLRRMQKLKQKEE
ncbi:hypothetical protein BGZ94_006674 [Podila epigama]|nr:hypothetical protein BGZ94_006674 [Podila epigama]